MFLSLRNHNEELTMTNTVELAFPHYRFLIFLIESAFFLEVISVVGGLVSGVAEALDIFSLD